MPLRRSAMTGDDISVHVDWLARRLTQQQEDFAATEKPRVTRVPSNIRLAKRDAYTPGLVAIGPLHAGDSERRLLPGHWLKMAYLRSLIDRGNPDPATHLGVIEGYVRLVATRDREVRAMYAGEDVNGLVPEDFVAMLVLDGCFIIEHLINVFTGREEPQLHALPFGPTQLSVDLVLAENQIPFFVLVDLIKTTRLPEFDTTGYDDPPVLLMKLVLYYLAGEKGRDMSDGLPKADDVSHILHLLYATVTAARTWWQPAPRSQDGRVLKMWQKVVRRLQLLPLLGVVLLLYPTVPESCMWSARYGPVDVPSASDMKWLCVRFKKAPGMAPLGIASLLGPVPLAVELEFDDVLQLPQLGREYRTAPLLLNLIAFEQSVQYAQLGMGDVSAYAWFMAKLAQSAEDVAMLATAKVVQRNVLASGSNEDVVRFFTLVATASEAAGKRVEESYLKVTLERLRNRTWYPILTKRADVQRYYITVPWRLVAAFVTVVTTVATILQAVAAFK